MVQISFLQNYIDNKVNNTKTIQLDQRPRHSGIADTELIIIHDTFLVGEGAAQSGYLYKGEHHPLRSDPTIREHPPLYKGELYRGGCSCMVGGGGVDLYSTQPRVRYHLFLLHLFARCKRDPV